MEFEHKALELPMDEKLEAKLKELEREGWGLVPGTKPVVLYQLVRVKQHDVTMELKFGIDDSKISILKPDGTMQ